MSVGAGDSVGSRKLPGDQIVPHPTIHITGAIAIQAAPRAVWPSLVQRGTTAQAGTRMWQLKTQSWHVDGRGIGRSATDYDLEDSGLGRGCP
jgi:hypothetical protein